MYIASILTYIFLIGFSIVSYTWIIPTYSPPDLGFGIPATFFPSLLVIAIAILSGIKLLFTIIKKEGKEEKFGFDLFDLKNFLPYFILLLLAMPSLEFLGFFLTSILYISLFQYFVGERRLIRNIATSIITTVIMYCAFWYGLKILLPQGWVFQWI